MAIRRANNDNRGTVLLVTLLIIFSIVATTVGMAFIVINEIQQSRDVDYSVIAYYAAEAGVEQGLFLLRKSGMAIHDLEIGESERVILDNGASWVRPVENGEPQIFGAIERDATLSVDLYDADSLSEDPEIGSIKIDGYDDTAWLETTLVEWPVGSGLTWGNQLQQTVYKSIHSFVPGEDICVTNPPQTGYAYRLRIKALYDDVEDPLIVTVWGDDQCSTGNKDILGRIVITGIGSYSHSLQAVKVSLPRYSPLSSVFDYIVFSEESLSKSD
ncbi:MAG: hypothetical protein V1684_02845 [bacterium]